MPIHLIWGDDSAAIDREIESLIEKIIDKNWSAINYSRFDGNDTNQNYQALEEIRTPAFGSGGRVIVIRNNTICNGCSSELSKLFETTINLIPNNSYLILHNQNKPDGRLKTTKILFKLIKEKKATEKYCKLPAPWDQAGQEAIIKSIGENYNLKINDKAMSLLTISLGNDSTRVKAELYKISTLLGSKDNCSQKESLLVTEKIVEELVDGIKTNALQIGESILHMDIGDTITKLDALINQGEPALRILATLTGQVRGWLWISLLAEKGERDVKVIAKAAGINNPKRIYILRKQIEGMSSNIFLRLLSALLDVEIALKKGVNPKNAFRDALIKANNHLVPNLSNH